MPQSHDRRHPSGEGSASMDSVPAMDANMLALPETFGRLQQVSLEPLRHPLPSVEVHMSDRHGPRVLATILNGNLARTPTSTQLGAQSSGCQHYCQGWVYTPVRCVVNVVVKCGRMVYKSTVFDNYDTPNRGLHPPRTRMLAPSTRRPKDLQRFVLSWCCRSTRNRFDIESGRC